MGACGFRLREDGEVGCRVASRLASTVASVVPQKERNTEPRMGRVEKGVVG